MLLERGGLYSMSEAIFVAMLVFLFVGTIDLLETMPRLVNWAFAFARKPSALVLSALGATAVTNAMTSSKRDVLYCWRRLFPLRWCWRAPPPSVPLH